MLLLAQETGADSGTTRFVLQVIALITGGGIVQLIVFLLRRRSEIAALDKTSTAPLLTSANELIERLQVSQARLEDQVEKLNGRLVTEQEKATERLDLAHTQNRRLAGEVAELRVDVAVLQRQIDQLTA
jgi:hypothetical protein